MMCWPVSAAASSSAAGWSCRKSARMHWETKSAASARKLMAPDGIRDADRPWHISWAGHLWAPFLHLRCEVAHACRPLGSANDCES